MLLKYRVKYITESGVVSETPVTIWGLRLFSEGGLATLTLKDGGSDADTKLQSMVSGSANSLEDYSKLGMPFETGLYATITGGSAHIWIE